MEIVFEVWGCANVVCGDAQMEIVFENDGKGGMIIYCDNIRTTYIQVDSQL